MKKNWILKEYKDGDEKSINSLLNHVYKISRDISYWQWEFKGNPKGFYTILAKDGNSIIGHLASVNREIKVGEEESLASLEVEGVTHPDYQRQGIFVALGQKLLDHLKKENKLLVYGFPNYNALPGHRKLGCTEIMTLNILIRPVDFKRISEKTASNGILRFFLKVGGQIAFNLFYRPKAIPLREGVVIKVINEFDSRFDEFWNDEKSQYEIILKRDSEYLKWRYSDPPNKDYKIYIAEKEGRILTWMVVRTMDKFGLKNGAIVDILSRPDCKDVMINMLGIIERDFIREKVDLIACSVPKWSGYHKILRKSGFISCPKRLNPKEEAFIIYPLSSELDREYLSKASNWYITWGDTDVV
jgi:GNAT superfamily N-acetyltransferase